MCSQGHREDAQYSWNNAVDHDDYLKAALFSEIQIMQMLRADNIVRIMDVMKSRNNYYIVQEMCDLDL